MINVYKIAQDYADEIMENHDYWDEDDLYDIVHEYADGSQHVIYYAHAHDFVQALPFDRMNDAEQQVADCGGINEDTTYNTLATQISYFALQQLIMEAVQKKLEEVA